MVGEIAEPGYLEGGDFFPAGRDLALLGIGLRSNFDACKQAGELFDMLTGRSPDMRATNAPTSHLAVADGSFYLLLSLLAADGPGPAGHAAVCGGARRL